MAAVCVFIGAGWRNVVVHTVVGISPRDRRSCGRPFENLPHAALVDLIHRTTDIPADQASDDCAANAGEYFIVTFDEFRTDRPPCDGTQNRAKCFAVASPDADA